MNKDIGTFEYVFESSWEVCNKVGGIYTVLSTRAHTMHDLFQDKLMFIGPDIRKQGTSLDFNPDNTLFQDWISYAERSEGLRIKMGRWNIPGFPFVALVDFTPFYQDRDSLFYAMWEDFQVDSMRAYGDYDESCLFAYAVGKVIESYYRFYHLEEKKVGVIFNEWMLGMGALYVRKHLPAVSTLFITHATSIGRSIAGNNKPLYTYMAQYNGDQMAAELNMQAKHSLEKQAAHYADCFTTVSDITASEATHLLGKTPDVVTPNGFEQNFVPQNGSYELKRKVARDRLRTVAEKLLGYPVSENTLFVSTSGRYEFRNKGIDVFLESMNGLRLEPDYNRETIAFVLVPAWMFAARADLKEAVCENIQITTPMQTPFLTHWLNNMDEDRIMNKIFNLGFKNRKEEKVKIIFVPCYLDGNDGIFNKSYYDILIGMDVTVYPSYYEPWGYTPLESIAFGIPTITTDLAGFGLWVKKNISGERIEEGVVVTNRTDDNYFEVVNSISRAVRILSEKSFDEIEQVRSACFALASKAEWEKFIVHYLDAFRIADGKSSKRRI
ncbi:MAG: glycosyltransferase [Massilibacteroides sp.]|nr:glycosyltransferase [Massilibacteroides sp.]MDD4115331.1 glycosyltransferase [Massilibacteroides sp.]MDD4660771.1 glycosyltransferase [Massilibacteroides sp.]